jgi:hypothetical protein
MRDLKSNIDAGLTFLPVSRTASGTGSAVEIRDYDSATAHVVVGAKAGGTITPSLEDSADGTTYTAVGGTLLLGSFAAITAGTSQQRVGYIGNARYLRGVFTQAGGTMDASFVILRGHPHRSPLA